MPVLQTHLKLHRKKLTGEGSLQGCCRSTGDIGDRTGIEVDIKLLRYDGPVTIGRSGDLEGPEITWTKTLAGWSSDWTVEIGQGTEAEPEVLIQVDAGRTNRPNPRASEEDEA